MNHLSEKKLLEQVEQILGPEGMLAKEGIEGLVFSQQQYDYARHAASGFCRFDDELGKASLNILEAATGTGKTIGYLVPLLLFAAQTGERVAVSTFTRQLQKQIVEEDAQLVSKWVKAITGKALLIARRVGVNNYVSETACMRLLNALEEENIVDKYTSGIQFLRDLIEWVQRVDRNKNHINSGLLDDYIDQFGLTAIPVGVILSRIQLEHSSPAQELQQYRTGLVVSKEADVIVINHALATVNAFRWTKILDDIRLRPISILVFDEADRLPAVAESLIGADLPIHKLMSIVKSYSESLESLDHCKKINKLYEYIMSLRPPEGDMLALSDSDTLSKYVKSALRSLIPLEIAISEKLSKDESLLHGDANIKTLEFIDVVNDLTEFCAALRSTENSALISWSPIRAYPSLRVSMSNPGRLMGRMWSPYDWDTHRPTSDGVDVTDTALITPMIPRSYLRAALFTSATLATPGRGVVEQFDEFASSIGVVRHQNIHNARTELYASFEPSKFGSMSFVLADPRVTPPTVRLDEDKFISSPLWLDYCSTMIRAAHAAGNRCLVLALSFSDAMELAKRLNDLPNLILHKSGQSLPEVLNQYIDNPRALLISPSAWEGVNLPGLVNHLVITRIPFSPKNVMQSAQLVLHLKSKGYSLDKINSIIHNESISSTRKKTKQGLGRGIRTKNHKVTVWIADPRFPLPDCMVNSLDDIILSAQSTRVHKSMASCIPRRFMEGEGNSVEGFSNAKLFLSDGNLYQPVTI